MELSKILEIALSQYGIAEIPGREHNPEVLKYFDATDYEGASWITDETAWCSAFANWVAMMAGMERTGALNARSWLKIGEVVHDPIPGDVVVFWRESPDSWKGHVGFYINETKDGIWVLGGNQGNRVTIHAYPKKRLLKFIRLSKT